MTLEKLVCLQRGYGAFIEGVERDARGVWIVMREGTRILFDDGEEKSFEEKLTRPDLADQLDMAYPKGRSDRAPEKNDDPGRVRHLGFFKAVYGRDEKAVRANLVDVSWLTGKGSRRLRFNRQNGAADALKAASESLARLPGRFRRYLVPAAGTFNWRTVAGTHRLSAHAFGIAIDLNPELGDYWRWHPFDTAMAYKNRIPFEIVEIFEQKGFIWGGKWYHFDTLHFEYRPELLDIHCVR